MRFQRLALTVGATALALGVLTGCGDDRPVVYTPTAYGEVINGVGHCYWTDSEGEAGLLLATGKCPVGWLPTPMPDHWHARYADFYASDAYVFTYVPVARRVTYVTYATNWNSSHVTLISTQRSTAVYRGSNGKTVTGYSQSKVTFGGGASRLGSASVPAAPAGGSNGGSGTFGGGSARQAPAPAPKAPAAPPPPRVSSGGSSFGGGSARTGGGTGTGRR